MKIKLAVAGVAIMLLFGGCDNQLEVRDRAFVQGAAIEYDDGYTVRLKLFDNEGFYDGKGKTFEEAVKNAGLSHGKDVFTGHTEIVVIRKNESDAILDSLVNEDISTGCIVVFDEDPVKYVEENNTEELVDIISGRERNGTEQKKSIRRIINDR